MYNFYVHAGSGNHGCEAIVRASASILKSPIVLFSAYADEDEKYGVDKVVSLKEDVVESLDRNGLKYFFAALYEKIFKDTIVHTSFTRKQFLKAVKKGDICFSIGGDNYCYGGLDTLYNLNRLIKQRGGKTVLWGCSIEPDVLNGSVIKDLSTYDLITTRETITYNALIEARVDTRVVLVSDPAFTLKVEKTELPNGFIEGNTIGINLSPLVFDYVQNGEVIWDNIYALIEHILVTTDCVIALISHVNTNRGGDLDVLKVLFERYKDTGRVVLVDDQNCMRLKYIISKCRMFIGARTHATIAAYSTNVPTLVLGYSVKSRGIAKDLFGTDTNYVLPVQRLCNPIDLKKRFDWLLENEEDIRKRLKQIMPEYISKAYLGKDAVTDLL